MENLRSGTVPPDVKIAGQTVYEPERASSAACEANRKAMNLTAVFYLQCFELSTTQSFHRAR